MSRRRTDCIPVRREGSGTRYDGQVWYELISSLKTVNDVAVQDSDTPLEKSCKHGDRVTLEFILWNYRPRECFPAGVTRGERIVASHPIQVSHGSGLGTGGHRDQIPQKEGQATK